MLFSKTNMTVFRGRAPVGVTLIEVMMSTMVVSLGILGLISLIPLGTHLTERGTRADRIASLGERIYHEARARGVFDANRWIDATTGGAVLNAKLDGPTPLPVRQPYMIDPTFFGAANAHASRRVFPYPGTFAINGDPIGGNAAKPMRMWRISIQRTPGSSLAMTLPQTRLAFQSNDDLSIERPRDGDLPPFQTFFMRDDPNDSSNPQIAVRRQAMGEYTWMIMLTPAPFELGSVSSLNSLNTGEVPMVQPPINLNAVTGARETALKNALANAATDEYTASIIIMKNRQGRIPQGDLSSLAIDDPNRFNERVVAVTNFISSGGYSTGEVELQITNADSLEQAEEQVLKLSNGDWLCLAARLPLSTVSDAPKVNYPRGDLYQWYRVVMVDEVVEAATNTYTRRVTISGPDWSSLSGSNDPTHAIIVDGVVGVYQKRVRLEGRTPWAP